MGFVDEAVGASYAFDCAIAFNDIEPDAPLRRHVRQRLVFYKMNLTFLGTRGEIKARTRRHRMHTALLVSHLGAREMFDCAPDWLGKLKRVSPSAINLLHASPDHARALRRGPRYLVAASEQTWQSLQH